MGIFGQSSPFDADVEKATNETNTNEDWSLILDVCDKVSSNTKHAKDCLKAILKRMGHNDPHVVMQALTLLDACVNNCGRPFHLEVASREFVNEFQRLLGKAQPQVSLKMRALLKSWVENDFRRDPELDLIRGLYMKLKMEKYDFSNLGDEPAKASAKASQLPKDPNVVTSQQEEDDIAKAIELSLKETKSSPKSQAHTGGGTSTSTSSANYPSLYPSFTSGGATQSTNATNNTSSTASAPQAQAEPRKVRALYDFEAAEENELTFFAGEILHVLDDSDQNWWKGYNQRGEGLFPSNFVTADLSVDPKRLEVNQHQTKNAQFNSEIDELQQKTDAAIAAAADANQRVEIDEAKIDRLLHLLHEANPEDPTQDSDEMLRLEQEVHQMGPLIDAELERVDRKHAQLTQLSSDLVDAINLYHSLMRDDRTALLGSASAAGLGYVPGMAMNPNLHAMQAGVGLNGPNSLAYQGPMPNPQMLYGMTGYAAAPGNAPANNFQMQMPTQSYMPTTSMPSVATATTANNSALSGSTNQPVGSYNAAPQQIPVQYQNGHMHTVQTVNGQHQLNSTMPAAAMQQPQPLQQTNPPTTNFSILQQQQYAPATGISSELQQQQQPAMMTAQQAQILQHQHPQQQQQQPQQQFMSPQHSSQNQHPQQQQLPYMPQMQQPPHGIQPNGQQYLPQNPGTDPSTGQLSTQHQPQMFNNNSHMDQFAQMQQQMAAMSLQMGNSANGGAMGNQGISQSFLNQNDPKQSIPIYQQQR